MAKRASATTSRAKTKSPAKTKTGTATRKGAAGRAKTATRAKAVTKRKAPPKPRFKAALWRHAELPFIDCEAAPGEYSRIARVINKTNSRAMGGGYEIMSGTCVHWTVLYDEALFIHEGQIDIVTNQGRFACGPGDIVWLPAGTELDYDASRGRCGFFYMLHPYDWAKQYGMSEP